MLDEFNTLSVLYGGHLMKKVHRKIATLRKREMSEEDDKKKNESEANTVTVSSYKLHRDLLEFSHH